MNSFTRLPSKVKIRKCTPYFSGFFITLEWHFCLMFVIFGSNAVTRLHGYYLPKKVKAERHHL